MLPSDPADPAADPSADPVVQPAHRYHHGDLPNALKAAAADLIAEKGPAGFSLREVARRAGVSHAAPAHHFGDSTGLLTALAVDAFTILHTALAAAAAATPDPAEQLVGIGRAYVAVALDYPAHCAVLFRPDLVDTGHPDYQAWGDRTYGELASALARLLPDATEAEVEDAGGLCWATMQGLVVLAPSLTKRADTHGEPLPDIEDLSERFSRLLLRGLRPRPA